MNKTIAKLFYKERYVIIKIIFPDKRMKTYYEIPNNNIVSIKEIEKSFTIDEEKALFTKGIPTFYYNSNSTCPIRFYPTEEELQFIEVSPEKLFGGIENKLVTEMFSKFSKQENANLPLLLSGISILLTLGIGVLAYVMFDKLGVSLQEIKDIISSLWG